MTNTSCRRCGGRGSIDKVVCFVCGGKGRIDFDSLQLEEYFQDLADKIKPE